MDIARDQDLYDPDGVQIEIGRVLDAMGASVVTLATLRNVCIRYEQSHHEQILVQ